MCWQARLSSSNNGGTARHRRSEIWDPIERVIILIQTQINQNGDQYNEKYSTLMKLVLICLLRHGPFIYTYAQFIQSIMILYILVI